MKKIFLISFILLLSSCERLPTRSECIIGLKFPGLMSNDRVSYSSFTEDLAKDILKNRNRISFAIKKNETDVVFYTQFSKNCGNKQEILSKIIAGFFDSTLGFEVNYSFIENVLPSSNTIQVRNENIWRD